MRICNLTSLLFLFVSISFVPLQGQDLSDVRKADRQVVVTGRVGDQTTGRAIENARITFGLAGGDELLTWEGSSGSNGQFVTGRIPQGAYLLRISALSFASVSQPVMFTTDGVVELRVELVPAALQLDPIVVTSTRQSRLEREGFFDRREIGLGHSFTREEIEARGPSRLSDLFYGIPGTRVLSPRPGRPARVRLRDGCVPRIVLDGVPLGSPIALDELLTVGEVEAVEVYHGSSAPVQYLSLSCGTILVWTRELGSVEGEPFSWRKLLATLGLLGTLVFLTPR